MAGFSHCNYLSIADPITINPYPASPCVVPTPPAFHATSPILQAKQRRIFGSCGFWDLCLLSKCGTYNLTHNSVTELLSLLDVVGFQLVVTYLQVELRVTLVDFQVTVDPHFVIIVRRIEYAA